MTVRGGAWVELSQGNLNNGHFYLTRARFFFPADAIGGPNVSSAGSPIEVAFPSGEVITCDIAGDKMILRDRGATPRFFEAEAAEVGDLVLIERVSERRFSVRLMRSR